MVKNKQTIQAKSLNKGFDSSEKTNKQTNKKQQLEWIQSGSVFYFKARIKPSSQAVLLISSSANGNAPKYIDREGLSCGD